MDFNKSPNSLNMGAYDKQNSYNNNNNNSAVKYEKYGSSGNTNFAGKNQSYQYRNGNDKTRNYQQQSYVHNVQQNQNPYMQQPMSFYVSTDSMLMYHLL